MNIPADKFFITGHSFYQPIVPNEGNSGRAVNRRVEIVILKERPYAVNEG
jgi:flagellar motor protein MotB